jgi:flagellin
MTGIVLSAAVRQNLLSLQSTAALLATTQNDLSTGNKVNSALDNPTNYFTAAALNGRASDISNLLDGIGNGVQVLQAANTGITSLQSLVASAQSVANQVLQTPVGFDTKSSVSTPPIAGANVNNLLGTGTGYTDATFAGATATGTITAAFTNVSSTGTVVNNDDLATSVPITTATLLVGTASSTSNDLAAGSITNGSTLVVNGTTITFSTGTTSSTGSAASGFTVGIGTGSTASVATVLSDIDAITGSATASSITGGKLVLQTGTTANLTITGSGNALAGLGLTGGITATRGGGATSPVALAGTTLLSGTTSSAVGALSAGFTAGDTLTVDGKTLTFVTGTAGANQISTGGTVASLLAAIDAASGNTGPASSISGGAIVLHTGTANANLTISSSDSAALTALGLGSSVTQAAGGSSLPLAGKTLLIAATGTGTPTNITFGTGAGQISTLNQLNSALNANNLQATIDSTGVITIVTSNNSASATIGAITGTAATAGNAFNGLVGGQPVVDPNSQATRAGLVFQYNNILKQIDTTSQDSSFNGVNLLEGDTLNLTFDETGKSTLAIQGVTFNTAGLSLSPLTAGTDFLDSNSATNILNQLNASSATLRSEASTLGSNLSIVEIRQDFSKSLINVLQTGASNLTLADTNEEAANSQALSTRQSIAVSALALANQSQQSVLQLLR